MELDSDKVLRTVILDGLKAGIAEKFRYNNQVDDIIKTAISRHRPEIDKLLDEAFGECLTSGDFRKTVITQLHELIARQLVQKFGGELEKQVNQLKSNPETRARITLAITEIVRTQSTV